MEGVLQAMYVNKLKKVTAVLALTEIELSFCPAATTTTAFMAAESTAAGAATAACWASTPARAATGTDNPCRLLGVRISS